MINKEASEVLKASSIQQMSFCKVVIDGKEFSVKEALNTAIKILEQEPCDDCISRTKAIEEADKLCLETAYDNEKVIEMLNDLPSVTPKEKTDWIPVSEKLPEESKRYVVATKYNDVMTDFYTGEGFLGDGIIAWMPLPAPFEPQESEDTEVANDRKDCPYRQEENGNCLPVGGFCTSVADKYCKHLSEVSE